MKALFGFICAIFLLVQSAAGVPIKRASLQELVSGASVVIKGSVQSIDADTASRVVWPVHAEKLETKNATVSVSGVLKGSAPVSPLHVLFATGPDDLALQSLEVGREYLLFLSGEGATMRLTDPQNAAIASVSGPPPVSAVDIYATLRGEFERALASGDFESSLAALRFLADVGNPQSLSAIAPLLQSTNDDLRVSALAASVALGDWRKAEQLVRFLDEHSTESGAFVFPQGMQTGAISLMESLKSISSADAGPQLVRLIQTTRNPVIKTRLVEAPCIRSDASIVPALSALLDDPAPDVSYAAYRVLTARAAKPAASKETFLLKKESLRQQLHRDLGPAGRNPATEGSALP